MSTSEPAAGSIPAGAVPVPARIAYVGSPPTAASADLVRRSPRERMTRAALAWVACWGLAVGAIFIPLLHFILVPSLVLAGPLVARSRWNERATVLGVRGTCPACGKAQALELKQPAKESIPFRCEACGRPLALLLEPGVIESDGSSARGGSA